MKSFLIIAAMLALTGCMTAPSAMPDFSFAAAEHQGKGILAGSLTAQDEGHFSSQDAIIYFDPTDPKSKLPRARIDVNNQCKPDTPDLDFRKPCGKVFAVVLPAGDYTLQEWYIQDFSGVMSPQHWQGPKVTVQAGKVTYVGGIEMVFDPAFTGDADHSWFGWPRATDQHARDIPLLLSRLPRIKADDIVMQALTLDPPGPICTSGQVMMVTLTHCESNIRPDN